MNHKLSFYDRDNMTDILVEFFEKETDLSQWFPGMRNFVTFDWSVIDGVLKLWIALTEKDCTEDEIYEMKQSNRVDYYWFYLSFDDPKDVELLKIMLSATTGVEIRSMIMDTTVENPGFHMHYSE